MKSYKYPILALRQEDLTVVPVYTFTHNVLFFKSPFLWQRLGCVCFWVWTDDEVKSCTVRKLIIEWLRCRWLTSTFRLLCVCETWCEMWTIMHICCVNIVKRQRVLWSDNFRRYFKYRIARRYNINNPNIGKIVW